MTGDEIRNVFKVSSDAKPFPADVAAAAMLQEIAAQLADLNALLRDGASPIAVALCASNDVIPVRVDTSSIDWYEMAKAVRNG